MPRRDGYPETVGAGLGSDRRYGSRQAIRPHLWCSSANRSCALVSSALFASLMLAIEMGGTIPRYRITDKLYFCTRRRTSAYFRGVFGETSKGEMR